MERVVVAERWLGIPGEMEDSAPKSSPVYLSCGPGGFTEIVGHVIGESLGSW